jgi:signal transduction histidine kinase
VLAGESLDPLDIRSLQQLAVGYARRAHENVAVFDQTGRVLVAAGRDQKTISMPYVTHQVQQAMSGARPSGVVRRPGPDLFSVAMPIGPRQALEGVVVITTPTTTLQASVRRNQVELVLGGAVALCASVVVGLLLARSLTKPLGKLERAVGLLGDGQLSTRMAEDSTPAEIARLAQQFNAMATRLEELVEAQQAFVSHASHQLRTPLTALRLRLENLEHLVGPEGRDDASAAIAESTRLSRLVDGLLQLARAEGTRPGRELVDVGGAVLARCQAWDPLAEERCVELRAVSSGSPGALAVPGYLDQVLDNLIANALEVSRPDTVVELRAERRGSSVEVRVTDQGPGMTPAERLRAFDPFWRSKDGGGGAGLGLAIVRQLVRSSGGDVQLGEARGGGLEVTVRLDVAPVRQRAIKSGTAG